MSIFCVLRGKLHGNTDVNNGVALQTFADATLHEGFSTWRISLSDNAEDHYIVRVRWFENTLAVSIAQG